MSRHLLRDAMGPVPSFEDWYDNEDPYEQFAIMEDFLRNRDPILYEGWMESCRREYRRTFGIPQPEVDEMARTIRDLNQDVSDALRKYPPHSVQLTNIGIELWVKCKILRKEMSSKDDPNYPKLLQLAERVSQRLMGLQIPETGVSL